MTWMTRSRATGGVAATLLAAATASCASAAADGRDVSEERAGKVSEAIARPPAAGTTYVYLRANVTDWNLDSVSELYPTADPNVFQTTVTNALSYDGAASVTEIFGASGVGQWGTSQAYWSTQGASTFAAPGTSTLVSHSSSINFNLHFASQRSYVVTFNIGTGVLSIAVPTADGGLDAAADSSANGVSDAGPDAADAGLDAAADAAPDGGGVGSWTVVSQAPPFHVDTALLLTDGRVMAHEPGGHRWAALKPDANGSYANGTWSTLAAFDASYAPQFFASAVLPDGRVIVEGGEYNTTSDETMGRIYDPVRDQWTVVSPPSGWTSIGDAPSVVLANGTFMLAGASGATPSTALFNPLTLTWTATGANRTGSHGEEGWTLLPSGKVVTASVNQLDSARISYSQIYDPSTGAWTLGPTTNAQLVTPNYELGPALLMTNGKVFQAGGTNETSIYDPSTGTWTRGPNFPNQLACPDSPAALLPNGRAFVVAGPQLDANNQWVPGASFLEFDGTQFTLVAPEPTMPVTTQNVYVWRLLPLPNGQLAALDGEARVYLYTPSGGPNPAWAPTITSAPTTVTRGASYVVQGTQLNGVSQACAYGDDAQCATNYPLVQIRDNTTGHVFYARTHGHSSMGVATGSQVVSTTFDVPSTAETGASTLVVVANGIASPPVALTVQ